MAFYSFARALDPVTGEQLFDDAARTWAGGHPMAERVARCLRTPKGSALRDPSYGIDTSELDNARDNAPARAEQAIRRALKRYADAGMLRDLEVEVELQGTTLLYEVRFRDPLDELVYVPGSL